MSTNANIDAPQAPGGAPWATAAGPAPWSIVLAFALVYVSWGTTYLAIREGVHDQQLPPALFGGTRVALAGLVLLAYLGLRGETIRLPDSDWRWITLSGLLLFVGGNGLITAAERSVESGVASILAATTPLWLGLMESLLPRGERLAARGWLGLLLGLVGVVLLKPADFTSDLGPLMVLGSAASWALGSLVVRYRRPSGSHLAAAAYQMIVGGTSLALIGLALGEAQQLTPERITARACFSFFYLLIVGSLVGFVAFNWLLRHVPATLVGTYAYVNPLVAVFVGWILGREEISAPMICGMAVILTGVALVRGSRQ